MKIYAEITLFAGMNTHPLPGDAAITGFHGSGIPGRWTALVDYSVQDDGIEPVERDLPYCVEVCPIGPRGAIPSTDSALLLGSAYDTQGGVLAAAFLS